MKYRSFSTFIHSMKKLKSMKNYLKPKLFKGLLYDHLKISYAQRIVLLQNLSTPHMIQSNTMRKLNPMKSPNTPPTSATRERAGQASTSFRTWILLLTKDGRRIVYALAVIVGSSTNCNVTFTQIYIKICVCSSHLVLHECARH